MPESQWIPNQIRQLVTEHGAVPPPWFMFPDTHPCDICWRMGAGESHVMVFYQWWEENRENYDEEKRIEYFRKWPPPPRWLEWMIDVIWDLEPGTYYDDPELYATYFARSAELGFGSQAEFEKDMDDPKWLPD